MNSTPKFKAFPLNFVLLIFFFLNLLQCADDVPKIV